jgi:hypothetical protein
MVDYRMKNAAVTLRLGIVATAIGLMLSVTGCVQSSAPLAGGKATGESPTSSATPTAKPLPSPTRQKFTEDCDILLTPAQVYAYNPNFVVDPAYSPAGGSVAAQIAAELGQTCGWVNETSGHEIEVAIATPTPSTLATAKAAASSGAAISSSGKEGFFTLEHGVGSAQFFFGTLWLDVSSVDFGSAGDAKPVYSIVVKNQLTAGG